MALVLDGNGSMTVGNGDITGLSDGAIETTALGTGTIIQVRSAYSNTVITCTSGAAAQEVVGLTFTPLYSNSLIYVVATTGQARRTGFSTATSNWGNYIIVVNYTTPQVFTDNSFDTFSLGAIGYPQSEQDVRVSSTLHATLKSWTGAKRISANGSMGSSEGSFSFNYQNNGATMMVLEIKQ